MSYTTSLKNVPNEVQVGEPFAFGLEVCCTNPNGCDSAEYFVSIGGERVLRAGARFSGEFCVTFPPGSLQVDPNPPIALDRDTEQVIINEPGTYTVEGPNDTASITAVESFDPANVSVDCWGTIPVELTVGDDFEVRGEVVNNNLSQAGVVVEFQVGDTTTTKAATVPANSSQVVVDTFEAASVGEASVSVRLKDVAEGDISNTHDPTTPTF